MDITDEYEIWMKRMNPNLSRIFNSIWIRIQIFTKNHVFHKDIFGEDFVKNNEFKILFSWKTEFRFWIQTMLLKDVATFKFWIRVYPRFGSEFRTALYWESECYVGLLELFMHLGWVVVFQHYSEKEFVVLWKRQSVDWREFSCVDIKDKWCCWSNPSSCFYRAAIVRFVLVIVVT